jgi:hypothetical protein
MEQGSDGVVQWIEQTMEVGFTGFINDLPEK